MPLLTKMVGRLPYSWITSVARLQWRHPYLRPAVNWAANRFRYQDDVIQQGEGRGLRFNVGGANAGYMLGTAEPAMQAAIAALVKPGMVVYDVGANVGFFSMIAARLVGSKGRVVSFEPLPINAERCAHNAGLNTFDHVTVRTDALGTENGSASFFTSSVPTLGKLTKFGPPDEVQTEITVSVRKLDTVIDEVGLPKPDFIKMDVEGAEVDVLEGASRTIAIARPLFLIELHGTNEAIARTLEKQKYVTHVLGSHDNIRVARWSAHVIAVPQERTDLAAIINRLTEPTLTQ